MAFEKKYSIKTSIQHFIHALFYSHWTALETQSLTEILNSIFGEPNGTALYLHLNQTYTLTLNRNFVAKNNKTEKMCYSI